MENYAVRFANIDDHEKLVPFYRTYFKPGHPLYHKDFWLWQFGNERYGRSIIAEKEDGSIVGHLGCTYGGGLLWLINILVNIKYSNTGIISALFNLARTMSPLAGAMVNAAGQALVARRQWYRYADLLRFAIINPALKNEPKDVVVKPLVINPDNFVNPPGYYWKQPGIRGMMFEDNSTAVIQPACGGLRLVDGINIKAVEEQAWEIGFNWIDMVLSWNDPLVATLQRRGWNTNTILPWYLNPVDFSKKVAFNFFSEEPIPKDFLFHRSFADLGRVGVLYESTK